MDQWKGLTVMSDKSKNKSSDGGKELYCIDENGNKKDSGFHKEILTDGDGRRARAVSRSLAKELGLSHIFHSSEKTRNA
jgi:hypothetical protein